METVKIVIEMNYFVLSLSNWNVNAELASPIRRISVVSNTYRFR